MSGSQRLLVALALAAICFAGLVNAPAVAADAPGRGVSQVRPEQPEGSVGAAPMTPEAPTSSDPARPGISPTELAGPCSVGPARSCVLNLMGTKAPEVPANCLSAPWSSFLKFEQPARMSNSDGDAFWESVVQINLDPNFGCGCAVFVLTYDDQPSGFTVNIGDSPTNDGWGGDAGTTPQAAEAQILNDRLSVYTTLVVGKVDEILSLDLRALPGRSLTLTVCDEAFSFDLEKLPDETVTLQGKVSSLFGQHLFALGGQPVSADAVGPRTSDYKLYAGFNRVIHVRGGSPSNQRIGKGLKRAEIYLTP